MHKPNHSPSEVVAALSEENKKKLENLSKEFDEKRDELSALIKKYPISSVAIAAGIGFLIGRLFSNRK